MRLHHLAGASLLALLGIGLSLMHSSYQMRRLVNFIDPERDPDGFYQLKQSLWGMGNGGLFGVGLGNSMQKEQYLPEPHTDFVFSVIGEEMGLVGTLVSTRAFRSVLVLRDTHRGARWRYVWFFWSPLVLRQ